MSNTENLSFVTLPPIFNPPLFSQKKISRIFVDAYFQIFSSTDIGKKNDDLLESLEKEEHAYSEMIDDWSN